MSAVAVDAPPLPTPLGAAGLLRFMSRERGVRRPIEQVRQVLEENPTGLSLDELASVLFTAWLVPEVGLDPRPPLVVGERDEWVRWFRLVGFLSHGSRLPYARPSEPLTLYRGSEAAFARSGMSWTPSERYAREYAAMRRRQTGADAAAVRVYAVEADPSWVLAVAAGVPGLAGTEYVLDVPEDAEVREVGAVPMQTWGRSAAGLLVVDRGRVLMQRRASWVQHGGTWSVPGGAVAAGEEPLAAALRELREETGIAASALRPLEAVHVAEPVRGWTYTTHVARLRKKARARVGTPAASAEATEHRWVRFGDVDALELHPGFAASWGDVRSLVEPVRPVRVLTVCLGNVCRSPLAELEMRRMAAAAGVAVEVRSAGLRANDGEAMEAGSAACAARHGLDGSAHTARRLDAEVVAWADVVVALAFHVAPAVERLAAEAGVSPVIVDRPAVNPWRMPAYWHEQAYREISATCADVIGVVRSVERSRS
ncbi:NUDIX domain-containing protein [Microbacterium sp.]|uniref:NUDIX domain-containing protein n=1 Tax=Microbacterium sp. TaxID=51671 RepID=UPI0035B34A53